MRMKYCVNPRPRKIRRCSFCLSHAAQSYIKTDWSEKAKEYLDSAAAVHADILPEERNSELYIEGFYTYSNAQVLYYVYDSVDYHKALTYVSEALELADSRGDIRQSVIFGLNHVILNTMLRRVSLTRGLKTCMPRPWS